MPIGGTAFFGQNQSPRITTNYINQFSRRGDPAPGVPVSTAQVSGSIVQPYYGMAGGKLTITGPWAAQFADPSVGPFYGGIVQYVQFNPSDSAPPIRGQVMFWLDELNYIVTNSGASPGNKVAGIAINPTTQGNWDFIQITGIASVRFSSAAALGAMIGTNPASNPAVGVTATVMDSAYLGKAVLTAPTANSVSPVELNLGAGYNM